MNWKQLYTSANKEERAEAIVLILAMLEARQHRKLFAHYVGKYRTQPISWPRVLRLTLFGAPIYIVGLTLILLMSQVDIRIMLPLMLFYEIGLLCLLWFTPQRRQNLYKRLALQA